MLTIHRAERADRLVDALASVLLDPLDDPLAAELVAVPTRGVERWLAQRLPNFLGTSPGRHDGVCANVTFPFPGRLVSGAKAEATGIRRRRRSVAARAVGVAADRRCRRPPRRSVARRPRRSPRGTASDPDETLRARRFAAVRHLAELFDRYGVQRPEMIDDWAGGNDTDGLGRPLPLDVAWQATLGRHLRERVGAPSPAERLPTALARLGDEPGAVDLPARLSLFGLTRLPASHVDVFAALAVAHDVNLFLLHPSPVLCDRIGRGVAGPRRAIRRHDDPPRQWLTTRCSPRGVAMPARCSSSSPRPTEHHRCGFRSGSLSLRPGPWFGP